MHHVSIAVSNLSLLGQPLPRQRLSSSLSAQDEASRGFKASEVRRKALRGELAAAQHNRSKELLDLGAFLSERTLRREAHYWVKGR